jgi:hypothetical protein
VNNPLAVTDPSGLFVSTGPNNVGILVLLPSHRGKSREIPCSCYPNEDSFPDISLFCFTLGWPLECAECEIWRTGVRFSIAKSGKLPVFFPVSREFSRRKVSARLRPPPRSLGCCELLQRFLKTPAKSPPIRGFLQPNRTRENEKMRPLAFFCESLPFSRIGRLAVRFRELREANGTRSKTD